MEAVTEYPLSIAQAQTKSNGELQIYQNTNTLITKKSCMCLQQILSIDQEKGQPAYCPMVVICRSRKIPRRAVFINMYLHKKIDDQIRSS